MLRPLLCHISRGDRKYKNNLTHSGLKPRRFFGRITNPMVSYCKPADTSWRRPPGGVGGQRPTHRLDHDIVLRYKISRMQQLLLEFRQSRWCQLPLPSPPRMVLKLLVLLHDLRNFTQLRFRSWNAILLRFHGTASSLLHSLALNLINWHIG